MRSLSLVIALVLVSGACRKRSETTVTETRPTTMRDDNLKLDATSNERFGSAGAMPSMPKPPGDAPKSPVAAGHLPDGWAAQPGNAFRLLNYSFGKEGEVSVSLSRGGVIDNVNRWVGQFGGTALDAAGMDALEKAQIAGFEGVLLKADGDYAPGMGRPSQTSYGLLGVVAEKGGEILTVKMIGPADEVTAEEAGFRSFLEGLKLVE
ncbi:hypothetical protein [Haloferula sp.]|uniref:hypothetical protein n=1 Tax=Haloferula sp. TaxID=2497595 RepID=UPI00329A8451